MANGDQLLSRTSVLLAEVSKQFNERRAHIDGATDLSEVTIKLKLNAGTTWIRGVTWEEERSNRTRTYKV